MPFSITVSFDELRLDPKRAIEFHGLYADANIGHFAVNQTGAFISDKECIFEYGALPPGVCCVACFRNAYANVLQRIVAPIASPVQ